MYLMNRVISISILSYVTRHKNNSKFMIVCLMRYYVVKFFMEISNFSGLSSLLLVIRVINKNYWFL